MSALDDLPVVHSFFGADLRTGCLIIAAIGIFHPMAYGCSFFVPMSYLLVTIWVFVALFFAANIVLYFGILKDDALLLAVWVWYAVIFVVVMLMMMILLAVLFSSRNQKNRVCVVIVGILWYVLTVYFILVVNSHRKALVNAQRTKLSDPLGDGPLALPALRQHEVGPDTLHQRSERGPTTPRYPELSDDELPTEPLTAESPTRTPERPDVEEIDQKIDDKAMLT